MSAGADLGSGERRTLSEALRAAAPRARRGPDGGHALTPLAAFAVALAGVGLVAGSWARRATVVAEGPPARPASRPGPQEEATPPRAEALATFRSLRSLYIRSYHELDVSLLRLYAAPDAPRFASGAEIRWLARHDIDDRTRWATRSLRVVSRSPDEVVLLERLVWVPRFVHVPTGTPASHAPPELRTLEWTMRRYRGEWRLYEAVEKSAVELRRSR